jgi:hypothetical protein
MEEGLTLADTFYEVVSLSSGSATTAPRTGRQRYLEVAIVLLIINTISALFFIGLVNRPVFDDPNNFPDAQRYATDGVSLGTVRQHINPTGPTSFIWMAVGIRIIGGNGLRDARLAVLFSWLLLGAGVLIGARHSSCPQLWYAALMVTLVFPHTLTATATVLTEGPAMFFAVLGALAWVQSVSKPTVTAPLMLLGTLGGLLIGIAVTCRQYYLALLPPVVLLAFYRSRAFNSGGKWRGFTMVPLSLAATAVPILPLIFAWKGLSSPGMVSGMSYGTWTSKVGLNLFRPMIAMFYVALYLVPLTLPAVVRLRFARRRQAYVLAVIGGTVAALFSNSLLQPGPVRSVIQSANRVSTGVSVLCGLVAALTVYNAVVFTHVLWQKQDLLRSPLVVYALLAIAFFVVEQVGVAGNIPFYELYVLQVAPFLGLIAFAFLPGLTLLRLLSLVFLSLVSHALLWRYAFGS